jgi:hypothetical protein
MTYRDLQDDQHSYPVPGDWFAIDVNARPTLYSDPEPPRPPSRWERLLRKVFHAVRKMFHGF